MPTFVLMPYLSFTREMFSLMYKIRSYIVNCFSLWSGC